MFARHFTALSVIVFFFAIGTVVLADPPTVSIQQQAEIFSIGILVHVVVNCGDGAADGTIAVAARQGDFAAGNTDSVLDAQNRQEIAVFIPGPFVPGQAQASAILLCGPLLAGQDLGRTINIVAR